MAKKTFEWRTFLGSLSSFTGVLLASAVLIAATLGMSPLERRAARSPARLPTSVSIAWPPLAGDRAGTWLPKADQESLLALANAALGPDARPFDRQPLERIARALAASGWFDGTPRARRGHSGVIVVNGMWRVPAAVVRSGTKDHLIAWDARLMPAVYDAGKSRLTVIHDPAAPAPRTIDGPDYQSPWAGNDIPAALELLETVRDQKWGGQVTGIDCSRFASEGLLMLVTREGNRVVWGGPPSRPRLGEISTHQKLIHLAQLQHDFKRIDAGYPLIYVNCERLQFDTSASAAAQQQAGMNATDALPVLP